VCWKRLAAGRCCRSAVAVCLLGYLLTDGALGLRGQDSAGAVAESSVEKPVRTLVYNRDVRPVLAEHCFACHGPDSAAREADLRLDQRDGAVASGAIKSGDPD
jgi:mono/diheme cytochrome c family protein